jgi:ubiquinone/menaquinone biosynthesis C-methylase UbiE
MNAEYKKLDIGCGPNKADPSAVGIDISPAPGVDIVGDALEVLLDMADESVDEIYSSHFLEHHGDPAAILGQMARVLRTGGRLELRVPHFSDPWYYSDPTHRHMFGLYTFTYYFRCDRFRRQVPTYCRIDQIRIESLRLRFGSTRPFYLRHAAKKCIEVLVNSSAYFQELYEECFSGWIGCSEVHVMARKDGAS